MNLFIFYPESYPIFVASTKVEKISHSGFKIRFFFVNRKL